VEQDVLVLTPEKTIVSYRLAGLAPRVLGHLLDLLLVIVVFILLTLVVSNIATIDFSIGSGIFAFALFAIPLSYFILFEGLWNGRTPGKQVAGLQVRMADGLPVTLGAALGRNLLRPADFLPGFYFVGLLAMFTNPKGQRIGDLVANTVVVENHRPEPKFAIAPHSVGYHPLEDRVGDLKGMTLPEYNALRRFADRFPELPPEIQTKLVREVWQPIADRRNIPSFADIHPIYLAEAVVMKYGRTQGLL
jgi:uncharacterized RDD family membrane protein YckC